MLFTLGIEVLKSMSKIYETKTEGKLKDDNTTTHTTGDSQKDNNNSDRVIAP